MVYTADLKSAAARLTGSSPVLGTNRIFDFTVYIKSVVGFFAYAFQPFFKMSFRSSVIAFALFCLGGRAIASETITNVSNTNSIIWQKGWDSKSGGFTQAATFTAPSDGNNVLQTFSSYFLNGGNSTNYAFQALIYQWNLEQRKIVGPALFTQNYTGSVSNNGSQTSYTINSWGNLTSTAQPFLVTINPEVTLNAGTTYAVIYTVADATSIAYNSSLSGGGFSFYIGLTSTSNTLSTGGGQWFFDAFGTYSYMLNNSWNYPSNYGGTNGLNSAMVATFRGASPVPEPSTYGLIGLAALGLALAARRRKLKTA